MKFKKINPDLESGSSEKTLSQSNNLTSPLQEKLNEVSLYTLTFSNDDDQIAFDKFVENEIPFTIIVVMIVFCCLAYGWAVIQVHDEILFYSASRYIRLITIPLLIVYAVILKKKCCSLLGSPTCALIHLGNLLVLCHALSGAYVLWTRCYYGPCHSEKSIDWYICNPLGEFGGAPLDTLMANLFGVFVFASVVKTTRWVAVFTAVVINLLSIVVVVVEFNLKSMLFSIFTINILSGLLLYLFFKRNIQIFVSLTTLESTLLAKLHAENEQVVMEMQSLELRHLIGNVAHDLKTPLLAIVMELDNITSGEKSVTNLRSTCAFMSMMINRAIDYTKANAGIALAPAMETVDIFRTIRWVRGCVGASALGVPVNVEMSDSYMSRFVITDKQWLMENVMCLLSNALKFSIEGAIIVRCDLINAVGDTHHGNVDPYTDTNDSIRGGNASENDNGSRSSRNIFTSTSSAPPELFLRVEVEDSGVGLSEAEMANLFQPFKQAQRRAGGTGLGLYSLSKRIDAMGGKYGVSFRRDGCSGCRFWFTVPYRPDTTIGLGNALMSPTMSPRSALPAGSGMGVTAALMEWDMPCVDSGSTMDDEERFPLAIRSTSMSQEIEISRARTFSQTASRILIVDDSNMIQKTTSRMLGKAGYEVEVASNGAHCLKMLKEKQYDVILLDLHMPVLDGFQTIQRIRAKESARDSKKAVDISRDTVGVSSRHLALERARSMTSSEVVTDRSYSMDSDGFLVGMSRQFVVGVSANSDSDTREQALQAGMDAFVAKPISLHKLHDVCASAGITLST